MAAIYIECDMASKATGLSPEEVAEMAGYESAEEWLDVHPRAAELIAVAAERNGSGCFADFLRQCASAAAATRQRTS